MSKNRDLLVEAYMQRGRRFRELSRGAEAAGDYATAYHAFVASVTWHDRAAIVSGTIDRTLADDDVGTPS